MAPKKKKGSGKKKGKKKKGLSKEEKLAKAVSAFQHDFPVYEAFLSSLIEAFTDKFGFIQKCCLTLDFDQSGTIPSKFLSSVLNDNNIALTDIQIRTLEVIFSTVQEPEVEDEPKKEFIEYGKMNDILIKDLARTQQLAFDTRPILVTCSRPKTGRAKSAKPPPVLDRDTYDVAGKYPAFFEISFILVFFEAVRPHPHHKTMTMRSDISVMTALQFVTKEVGLVTLDLVAFTNKIDQVILHPTLKLEQVFGRPGGPKNDPPKVTLYYDLVTSKHSHGCSILNSEIHYPRPQPIKWN